MHRGDFNTGVLVCARWRWMSLEAENEGEGEDSRLWTLVSDRVPPMSAIDRTSYWIEIHLFLRDRGSDENTANVDCHVAEESMKSWRTSRIFPDDPISFWINKKQKLVSKRTLWDCSNAVHAPSSN